MRVSIYMQVLVCSQFTCACILGSVCVSWTVLSSWCVIPQ